nr:ATP-binding cassette domain-containing protein [Reyranella sp.]
MTVPAIELSDVRKNFGATEIIRGVDLGIARGERHAIIGPNGAGKTTLFNLISGRFPISSGSITVNGKSTAGLAPQEINRLGLSRSFQITSIFPRMTVFENIRCGLLWSRGYRYSFWHLLGGQKALNAEADRLLDRLNLGDRRNVQAGLLSYAEQRALEIGITIAGGADIILLDEPTAGMSHSETDAAVELIRGVSEGKTLIMVEHDMSVVFGLADRITVLDLARSSPPTRRPPSAATPPCKRLISGRSQHEGGAMMLEVRDLHALYGKSHILQGVDLAVDEGEIVSLLGRNGVGRSTTCKAIMGLVPPVGQISFKGRPIAGLRPDQIAHAGVGYVPEDRQVFPGLTVKQNLELGLKRAGVFGRWTFDDVFSLFPNLGNRQDNPAGVLSGGEQQMLTMCRTLMGDPDLVIIDEPTEGLAPMLVEQVGRLLDEIARRGTAILLVEQKLTIALKISHRLYVMGHGRIVFSGSPAELTASSTVRKEWLEV